LQTGAFAGEEVRMGMNLFSLLFSVLTFEKLQSA
jgi:hypothetical protein